MDALFSGLGLSPSHLPSSRNFPCSNNKSEEVRGRHHSSASRGERHGERRYYKSARCAQLYSPMPESVFHLHRITLRLAEESGERRERGFRIYRPEERETKLALLTAGRIKLGGGDSEFDLYTISGRVAAGLQYAGEVSLTEQQKELLLRFYRYVFEELLNLRQPWMSFQPEEGGSVLVAPVCSHGHIEWGLLERIEKGWQHQEPTSVKTNFLWSDRDLEDSVVVPTHRDMGCHFVEAVRRDLSPKSSLKDGQTFAGYYASKYKCQVGDLGQPLLSVTSTHKTYNMLSPIDESNFKKSLDSVVLIPELTKVHPVPAWLWRECQMLPFVLHRVGWLAVLSDFAVRHGLLPDVFSTFLPNNCSSFPPETEAPKMEKCGAGDFNAIISDERRGESLFSVKSLMPPFSLASAGETFNLERREFLGDSFLKFTTTVHLFFENEASDEGDLTTLRSRVVGNENLYRVAKKIGIHSLVNGDKFDLGKSFVPPLYANGEAFEEKICEWDVHFRKQDVQCSFTLFDLMNGKDFNSLVNGEVGHSEKSFFAQIWSRRNQSSSSSSSSNGKNSGLKPRRHVLAAKKSLADVVEALIGSVLLDCGQLRTMEFMTDIGICLRPENGADREMSLRDLVEEAGEDDPTKRLWKGIGLLDCQSPPTRKKISPSSSLSFYHPFHKESFSRAIWNEVRLADRLMPVDDDILVEVEERMGYSFQRKDFLRLALTLASLKSESVKQSNERLEFLGDGVLDYLVTLHIYLNFPSMSPGDITDLRSSLVNNRSFSEIAVETDLVKSLQVKNEFLAEKIELYSESLKQPEDKSWVERVSSDDLLREETCPVYVIAEPPKLLGDVFESLIGAVFLDSDLSLTTVWRVFRGMYGKQMDHIIETRPKNPIKDLLEAHPESVTFRLTPLERFKTEGKTAVVAEVRPRAPGEGKTAHFCGIGDNKKEAREAAAKCAVECRSLLMKLNSSAEPVPLPGGVKEGDAGTKQSESC